MINDFKILPAEPPIHRSKVVEFARRRWSGGLARISGSSRSSLCLAVLFELAKPGQYLIFAIPSIFRRPNDVARIPESSSSCCFVYSRERVVDSVADDAIAELGMNRLACYLARGLF